MSFNFYLFIFFEGGEGDFPGGSDGEESACNAGDVSFDPWVRKIPLEKGMATHSNILARRIPWTQETGQLQSVGVQRVRHNSTTHTHIFFGHSMRHVGS